MALLIIRCVTLKSIPDDVHCGLFGTLQGTNQCTPCKSLMDTKSKMVVHFSAADDVGLLLLSTHSHDLC